MRWTNGLRQVAAVAATAAALPGLGMLGPAPAAAALCGDDAVRISAKFSEAASLCGSSSAEGENGSGAAEVSRPDRISIAFGAAPAFAGPAAPPRSVRGAAPGRLDSLILRVGEVYRVDPYLLSSMVSAESAGRLGAVSAKGALGLMQVMPGTARELDVADPRRLLLDPELALVTGARFLKKLQARFGNDVPVIVAAYNAGPGAVIKAGGIPRYRETQGYVATVMRRYRQLLLAR